MNDERVYVTLPTDVLDSVWPTGFTLKTLRQQPRSYWIDLLGRYVDMGLLVVTGCGTKDDPYRYFPTVEDAFMKPEPIALTDDEAQDVLDRLMQRSEA